MFGSSCLVVPQAPTKPHSPALASAIAHASVAVELCAFCVKHDGLCWGHFFGVIPLYARPSWLSDIGTVYTEQTDVQDTPEQVERKEASRLAALRTLAERERAKRRRVRLASKYAMFVASLSKAS